MNYSEIQNYKGLIFDLDGTLINSMPYHALAWKQVATEHGFNIDIKDIYAMGGSASRDIAAYYKIKANLSVISMNMSEEKLAFFRKIFLGLKFLTGSSVN